MEVILAIIAIYLLYLLITKIIIPVVAAVGEVAVIIISAIGGIMGLGYAISNYCKAVKDNLNFKNWTWTKSSEPAKRSYFFGPGYAQLFGTIRSAFKYNAESGRQVVDTFKKIKGDSDGLWGMVRGAAGILYMIVAVVFIYVAGTILCAVFGIIHFSITAIFMVLIYILFSITWIIDRAFLLKNKIRSYCPVCFEKSLIPVYKCPACGAAHRKLVPSVNGIWHHKCLCGQKLPCTFLNGRGKIEAHCPHCDAVLVSSSSRQIAIQLIGGSSSGKTVYLSSFYHQFFDKVNQGGKITAEIDEAFQPYFEELERWYMGDECPATAQLSAQMYPVLLSTPSGVSRQFNIYDIAGEMFDGYTADQQILQKHFTYCDGMLFMIDPFSSGNLRAQLNRSGADMSTFSTMPTETVATSFINYLVSINRIKTGKRCDIPLSVVITKADIREVKREIGPAKIAATMRNNPGLYADYSQARDALSRLFLINNGMSATVDNLEASFSNIHYFPVSSMGHEQNGSEYEPWGVTEPIDWILPIADPQLSDSLFA